MAPCEGCYLVEGLKGGKEHSGANLETARGLPHPSDPTGRGHVAPCEGCYLVEGLRGGKEHSDQFR